MAETKPMAAVPPEQPTTERTCPVCGRVNAATLRFCSKCGQGLTAAAGATGPQSELSPWRTWWAQHFNTRQRVAKREYRRSLPALYRWRRVLIAVLCLALLSVGAVATKGRPLDWLRDRWYALPGTLVRLDPLSASVRPPAVVVSGSDPKAVSDNSDTPLILKWPPAGEVASCGDPRAVTIVLTFVPSTVYAIDIWAGPTDAATRNAEFKPNLVSYRFDGGPCQPAVGLSDTDKRQRIPLPEPVRATSLEVVVEAVQQKDGADRLTFRDVMVKVRP